MSNKRNRYWNFVLTLCAKIPHNSMQKCCDLYAILIFTLRRYCCCFSLLIRIPSFALASFYFDIVFLSATTTVFFFFLLSILQPSYALSLFFISGYSVCYTPRRYQKCFAWIFFSSALSFALTFRCSSFFGIKVATCIQPIYTMLLATVANCRYFSHVHVWNAMLFLGVFFCVF